MSLEKEALFNIGYGLYVITSNDGKKDNAFICNSVVQLTDNPLTVAVNINKNNYSCEIISDKKELNVNILNIN